MRTDRKSQYQLKKEKLQKIKKIIAEREAVWTEIKAGTFKGKVNEIPNLGIFELVKNIWEIVKDEK